MYIVHGLVLLCCQEGAQPLSEDVLKVSKVSPLDFMKRSLQDKQFVILDTRKVSSTFELGMAPCTHTLCVCIHLSLLSHFEPNSELAELVPRDPVRS